MKIGIRAEDKSRWEARIPLVPEHLGRLVKAHGVDIVVQDSAQRAFRPEEFAAAGVPVVDDVEDCDVIMGVKEVPTERLGAKKTYVFFSHTIKGQPYNMDMLRRLMALECNLIDYECIVDAKDRRLVFFGTHAGIAGMIDSLWSLGQRLEHEGLTTPLAELEPAVRYRTLDDAKAALTRAAQACRQTGALAPLGPVVIGICGNGRVSKGVQEISALLSPEVITPEALLRGEATKAGAFYQVVFEEPHMVAPKDEAKSFDLQTYYDHPEHYVGTFARYLPHLTTLVNCIYWEDKYPRLVTKADLARLYAAGETPRLKVIGDISCDIDGSIEATVKPTDPGNPTFVWDVEQQTARDGFVGRGPVIMAVEILPTEIPRESSLAFSEALIDLIPGLASGDPSGDFSSWKLPEPLERAVILHRGKLTKRFAYMSEFLAS